MNYKNDIIICNKQIGTQLHIPNKDVSYGIFRVFHDNFISILNKYVDKENLSKDIVNKIEKDLLFDKFLFDLVNFKTGLLNKNCMDKENFEISLTNYYSKKEYWNSFQHIYNKELIIRKFKEKIKNILKRNDR